MFTGRFYDATVSYFFVIAIAIAPYGLHGGHDKRKDGHGGKGG